MDPDDETATAVNIGICDGRIDGIKVGVEDLTILGGKVDEFELRILGESDGDTEEYDGGNEKYDGDNEEFAVGEKLGVTACNSVGECVTLVVEAVVGEFDGFISLFNDTNDGSDVGKCEVGLEVTLFDAVELLVILYSV